MPTSLIIGKFKASRDSLLRLVDRPRRFDEISCGTNQRESLEMLRDQPVVPLELSVSIGISGAAVASPADSIRLIDEAFCAAGTGRRNGSNRTESFCHSVPPGTLNPCTADFDTPQGHA